jgi:hypothetical protein
VARRTTAVVLAAAACLAGAPAAAAQGGDPNCALPGGTAGAPEAATPGREGSPDDVGSGGEGANPTEAGLPRRVDLKGRTLSRNRRWYFGVRDGRLYVKPNVERTGRDGPWQQVTTPACLDGDIKEISADDDELVAIDSARSIYTMDQALATPDLFNWTSRWGIPFWTGLGYTVPAGARAWAWSVISPREEEYWVDPAGNRHAIGEGKVSHVWSIGSDGQRFTFNDPWLPLDRSYEMCGPRRGRLRAAAVAASGSTVFAADRLGDLYTRVYDFDISGLDNLFFSYSYEDQRGKANPAIQLPPANWVQQPRIPGPITDRISVEKVRRGTEHRILRVESAGRPGFWEKDAAGLAPWRFVSTPGAQVLGRPVANPPGDAGSAALGAAEDARYVGAGFNGEIPDFNVYCSPSTLRVRLPRGRLLDLDLHVVDQIRENPRARGLDSSPRQATGTIEVNARARRTAERDPAARQFLDRQLGGRRFTTVDLFATTSQVELRPLGWVFRRAPDPPGGTCVAEPGFDTAAVSPRGRGLGFAVKARTESPVTAELLRVASLRRLRRPRMLERVTRAGGFTMAGPRANGVYVARISTLTPGGRVDVRRFAFVRRRGRFHRLRSYVTPERCELLRSVALSGPAFGGRRKPHRLGVSVRTVEPARAVLRLRRGRRTLRRLRLGTVRPERARRVRLRARGLRRGRYAVELSVTARDGRVERARLGANRL